MSKPYYRYGQIITSQLNKMRQTFEIRRIRRQREADTESVKIDRIDEVLRERSQESDHNWGPKRVEQFDVCCEWQECQNCPAWKRHYDPDHIHYKINEGAELTETIPPCNTP